MSEATFISKLKCNGPKAIRDLPIEIKNDSLRIWGSEDYADAGFMADWHNDRLQLLTYDASNDDAAVFVRLNPDGSVAEILVRDDLMSKVRSERGDATAWQNERDGDE